MGGPDLTRVTAYSIRLRDGRGQLGVDMAFHPDYGLLLHMERVGSGVRQYFYEVPIDRLSIINDDLFSTTLNMSVQGKMYAVSFDFPAHLFAQVISYASHDCREAAALAIKSREAWPVTISMREPFSIGLCAHLGELQRNENEKFIPLVVDEVFAVGESETGDIQADEYEDDTEEDVDANRYRLNGQDKRIIEATKQLLWKIVRSSLVAPRDLIGLGRILAALERLPEPTTAGQARMLLIGPDRWYGEHRIRHSWEVEVGLDEISIMSGGYFFRESTGGDSFTCLQWSASPRSKRDYADHWKRHHLVDDARPYETEIACIELTSGGYSLTVDSDPDEN